MVTPQELKNPEFQKSLKGYACAEVDKYIEYCLDQYAQLYRENTELEKKVRLLSAKLDEAKNEQGAVSATIVKAQQMADSIIAEANQRAADIDAAFDKSFNSVLDEYRRAIDAEQKKLFTAQKNAVEFKAGILDGYKQQVRLLCDLIPIDSLEDTDLKPVNEVMEGIMASAAGKLGMLKPESPAEESPAESEAAEKSEE